MTPSINVSASSVERSATLPQLSEPAVAALRQAVAETASQHAAGAAMRKAIRDLCADAHGRELRAEELLISVKGAWQQLPEVRALPLGARRSDLLDRVIAVCIEEFYQGAK